MAYAGGVWCTILSFNEGEAGEFPLGGPFIGGRSCCVEFEF